ncbi:TlpA family protein disulfide reductase [Candidatus Poribacteria bacterium]|nr:TlpA family protein disulfide reductase [Candidatus Poribacteria bacterium]
MLEKYDSTEFWYTFINSLYNQGLSSASGISEIDEETQEKLLVYLKEKIEEGVINGETALPPGLHDYLWRLPKEILPKARELTDSFLQSDSKNAAAALLRTIVEVSDRDAKNDPHIDDTFSLIPNDPGMNLVVINDFRLWRHFFTDIERKEKVLISLENLYLWAIEQEDTARYQEAKSFYHDHRITPYIVYKTLKDNLQDFKNDLENSTNTTAISEEINNCKSLIKKCRDFVSLENAAFRKNLEEQSADQQDLLDMLSDNTDIWQVYLKSQENRKKAPPRSLTQNDQDQLLEYFKAKIKEGVVGGKTSLPTQLHEYISDFPEVMHLELREFAEDVLESEPENGAAVIMLMIIVWESKNVYYGESDKDLNILEKAMVTAPNDPETCFYAASKYEEYFDPFHCFSLTALERLFERSMQQGESGLYGWLTKLYNETGRTPCYIYRSLMRNPDANTELISRCIPLITKMQHVFQDKLSNEPDDWYALRGLGDIYQTLGETELAKKYPWKAHKDSFEVMWEQKAWKGLELPNFTATTLDGTPISASDYRGKMVVLNFCAKSCGFCAPEIPYLKEVYEEHHDKGLEVIGVSLDKNENEIHEFTKEHEIPWLQIFDGKGWKSELAQFFGITSVPSQWLIDRDGTIISVATRGEQLGQLVRWTEITRLGNVIPDFTAVDVDGNSISTTTLQGKVVLLHFGSIHQEPELKHIDTMHKKHHDNGFEVIGVNISGWRDEDALRNVVQRQDHQGHYIYADHDGQQAALANQFGFKYSSGSRKVELPAYILIDKDGEVIHARSGKVHSPESWAAQLDKLVVMHLG